MSFFNLEQVIAKSSDPAATRRCYEQCLERGFSRDHIYLYLKCTEEVSPDLDEEKALARMHKIDVQYPGHNHQGTCPRCAALKEQTKQDADKQDADMLRLVNIARNQMADNLQELVNKGELTGFMPLAEAISKLRGAK